MLSGRIARPVVADPEIAIDSTTADSDIKINKTTVLRPKNDIFFSMTTFIGIIPARYASSRFPGKPLADICGMTMIERVYRQASKELDEVVVATDDEKNRGCRKSIRRKCGDDIRHPQKRLPTVAVRLTINPAQGRCDYKHPGRRAKFINPCQIAALEAML